MKITTLKLNTVVGLFLLGSAVGCAYGEGSGDIAFDEEDLQQSEQGVNGTVSFEGCTTAQRTKIRKAVEYLHSRVTDGELQLGLCLADGVLSENRDYDAQQIAEMLKLDVVTTVKCADLPTNVDGQAAVAISGEKLTLDLDFVNSQTDVRIASVVAHQLMHNRGFRHQDDTYSSNSVPEQVQACISGWTPNDAVDVGYALYWNGERVGGEASWTREQAVTNCQWNKDTYPQKKVECFFDGAPLGYELYRDGARAGYNPSWSRAQAATNCQWNKDTYPQKKVECTFDGQPIGYELYRDGKRNGFSPSWTRQQAVNNCMWNKDTYPDKKVECFFDGATLGYELYWNGKRTGMDAARTEASAKSNCQWNRGEYGTTKIVECFYDGVPIP